MLTTLANLLGMIRFSHTVFALPFALLAALMAWTVPAAGGSPPEFRWRDLAGIVVCMVCARSAAMAFNRIADRRFDAENPRTRDRHLPRGTVSLVSAAWFTAAAAAGFVAGTLLFLPNVLPLIAALPLLAFLFGYSYAKRFTSAAHFWLGAALMLAPLAAWIAIRGELLWADPADALPALLLGLAVLCWVAGFDILYACQDVEFDVRSRLKSIPARLGVPGALRLAAVCHAGMVIVLAALPWLAPRVPFGYLYGAGVAAIGLLLAFEHWLVRPDDLSRVNIAFFHVNSLISIGLLIVGGAELLWFAPRETPFSPAAMPPAVRQQDSPVYPRSLDSQRVPPGTSSQCQQG